MKAYIRTIALFAIFCVFSCFSGCDDPYEHIDDDDWKTEYCGLELWFLFSKYDEVEGIVSVLNKHDRIVHLKILECINEDECWIILDRAIPSGRWEPGWHDFYPFFSHGSKVIISAGECEEWYTTLP